MYGITFPDAASMKDYQHRMEQAKERDHRNIGTQQELFFFDRMSPGSCFFMPHGTRIYNTLVEVRHTRLSPRGLAQTFRACSLAARCWGLLAVEAYGSVCDAPECGHSVLSQEDRGSSGDHSRNELAFCAQINSLE